MRIPKNDVPIETLFKHLLKDYKRICEYNRKLISDFNKLNEEINNLKQERKELQKSLYNKKVLERDYSCLLSRLRNYDKWKKGYKSMCIMLKRHGIPFKVESELLTEEDIISEIKELTNND